MIGMGNEEMTLESQECSLHESGHSLSLSSFRNSLACCARGVFSNAELGQ